MDFILKLGADWRAFAALDRIYHGHASAPHVTDTLIPSGGSLRDFVDAREYFNCRGISSNCVRALVV